MIEWINQTSTALIIDLQLLLIQNTLFLAIVLGALFIFRKKSPGFLSCIALLGVLKLLLPPIFALEISASTSIWFSLQNAGEILVSSSQTAGPGETLSTHSLLLITWVLISFTLFAVPIVKTFVLWARFRDSMPAKVDNLLTSQLKQNVKFFKSRYDHSPFVIGFFKPCVILPKAWPKWSKECKKAVLAHEIAHIRNRDHWLQLIQLLVRSLYFFDPLVYLLNRQLTYYREVACDDKAVSEIKMSPVAYSRYLVDISELMVSQRNTLAVSATFSDSKNHIRKRINYQLNKDPGRQVSWIFKCFVFAVLAALVVPLSICFAEKEVKKGSDYSGNIKLIGFNDDVSNKQQCLVYDANGNFIDPAVKTMKVRSRVKSSKRKPMTQLTPVDTPLVLQE